MNLLFDANLSWRLPKLLSAIFPKCQHVEQIDLPFPAKDFNDILSRNVLKIQNLHESPDLGILEIY